MWGGRKLGMKYLEPMKVQKQERTCVICVPTIPTENKE